MTRRILAPLALALGTLALAACGSSAEQPAAKAKTAAKPARTDPNINAPEGIAITDARFVLPPVKGNPGAAYFTVHNDSDTPRVIRSASVAGAQSAMIHSTEMAHGMSEMKDMAQIAVPARGELAFAPGGKHVMAMHLADTLQKGGTTDVTLTFANGDKATFPAEILAAGDAR